MSTFLVSPGVNVSEIDLTTGIVGAGTTTGAFAGVFRWGPVLQVTLIDSEVTLANEFGEPDTFTFVSFYTAANFLQYTNTLNLVRVVSTTAKNSTADGTGLLINNSDIYDTQYANGQGAVGLWAGKYPGALGNSITVSICDVGNWGGWAYAANFDGPPGTSSWVANNGGTNDEVHVVVIDKNGLWSGIAGSVLEKYPFLSKASDAFAADGSTIFYPSVIARSSKYVWWMDYPTVGTNWGTTSVGTNYVTLSTTLVFSAITGGPFTVGESAYVGTSFSAATKSAIVVSYTTGSKTLVVNEVFGRFTTSDVIKSTTSSVTGETTTTVTPLDQTSPLTGGIDGNNTIMDGDKIAGYDLFLDVDNYDASLILGADASTAVADELVVIAEGRKDAVVFLSPPSTAVVANSGNEVTAIATYTSGITSSNYVFVDGNWKYQYDKYNDVFRWIPLNGDIAGLAARTDQQRAPWFSFAGLNRGVILNVIKLAWNPNQTQRDALYKMSVNPVVNFPGVGPVLYGDKTFTVKPSAFQHINVRRLFIVLEKAIANYAKYVLFEFNDPFTRAQFLSVVNPYLRDVEGHRGVQDFKVICDTTNNTPTVIDANQFVGDIYIKPNYSINYIQLNFVAVRTGVAFTEVIGKF